jgi:hypothetical protein
MSAWLRPHIAHALIVVALIICSAVGGQESATVSLPNIIKAGEFLTFTVKLDRAPSFDGGFVQFTLIAPDTTISTSTETVRAGQTNCLARIQIPPDASGGEWRLHINGFFAGTKVFPLKSEDTRFQVIPNEHLVFPSSAEVRITPSQVQLLRTSAIQLQLQIQEFKAAMDRDQKNTKDVVKTVRTNIDGAINALNATQSSFRASAGPAPQQPAEQIFFDDLRASYQTVVDGLRNPRRAGASWWLEPITQTGSAQTPRPEVRDTILAQAALRPFEQNELAYKLVADAQSLTFDLTVESSPAGATVCYHRRGDPCHPNSEITNTVIKSLPFAIWFVEFHKKGYSTIEREHDPFREPNHVLNVDLGSQESPVEHH